MLKGDIRERALEDAREQARYMAVAVAVDLLTEEELQAGLDLHTLVAMDEAVAGHREAGEVATPPPRRASRASHRASARRPRSRP